jgi:hypothetical protein
MGTVVSLHTIEAPRFTHTWLAVKEGAKGLAGLWLSIARLKLSVLLVLRCRSFAFESLRLLAIGIAEERPLEVGDDGIEEDVSAVTIAVAVAGEDTAALRLIRSIGLRLLQKEQRVRVSVSSFLSRSFPFPFVDGRTFRWSGSLASCGLC